MDHNLVVSNVRGLTFQKNVFGLNWRARRLAIHELKRSERVSSGDKTECVNDSLILDMLGLGFSYFSLPTIHGSCGICLVWCKDTWLISSPSLGLNHVTVKVVLTFAPSHS
jgi:hypothetical protein